MSEPIHRVLAAKGHDVVSVPPSATVAEAVQRLAERNVGAVVVVEGDRLVGMLSERDVVRRLADTPDVRALTVREVMTTEVTTCVPSTTTDELMRVMTDGRFRHVPVLEDGRMVGLVSIGDVVKRRIDELATQTEQLTEYVAGTY